MPQYGIHYTLCILLLLAVTVVLSECPEDRKEQDHDEITLMNDLLCAYDSDARPVKDHKSPINVSVLMILKYFSFGESEETFHVHMWMGFSWKDEYLTWTPSDYGNIETIEIHSTRIWTPKMALMNADVSLYTTDEMYTSCTVSNGGIVMCMPQVAHSGICQTMLQKWPYDTQNCTLYFGSRTRSEDQVNFTFPNRAAIARDKLINGPGWKLLNAVNERLSVGMENYTYPILKYTFTLKRVAAGPAAIVVVPAIIIVILTLISLQLDVKNNIRLTFISFSLYGHFSFLTVIGYEIPKHSANTPIILLFLRDSLIITTAGIFETLILMYMSRRVTPAPGWIVTVNRWIGSGPGKYVVFTNFDPVENKNLSDENSSANEEKMRARVDWMQFVNLLNSVLFMVAVLVYFVIICVYIPRKN